MRRDLWIFLSLQLVAALLALASFRFIDVRWQAALLAGSGFVVLGVWMVLRTLRWPNRFRFFSFYMARAHLWLFSLPMLLVRIRYLGHDFGDVHFFGIPGPQFHRWSEIAYLVLVAGTVVDLIRTRSKKSPVGAQS